MTVKELQQILQYADPNMDVYVNTKDDIKAAVRVYNSNHYDAESNLKESVLVIEPNPEILLSFTVDDKPTT